MNKERRKEIRIQITRLKLVLEELNKIKNNEEDYYDNIPENLLSSSRAEDSEEAIESLDECIDTLEEAISLIELL